MPTPVHLFLTSLRVLRYFWWALPKENRLQASNTFKMSLKQNKRKVFIFVACGITAAVYHMEEVPLSKRKRLMWLSNEEIKKVDQLISAADQRERAATLPANSPICEKVRSIVDLVRAHSQELRSTEWNAQVLSDSDWNALSYQCGAIYVNLGLINTLKSDSELAFILGHEMGHVIGKHTYEQTSLVNVISVASNALFWGIALAFPDAASFWISEICNEFLLQRFVALFAVKLPYQRSQELEADQMGATFAARAGFDPAAAVDVCRRQASLEIVQKTMTEEERITQAAVKYLSTHPMWSDRADLLQESLPQLSAIQFRAIEQRSLMQDAMTLRKDIENSMISDVAVISASFNTKIIHKNAFSFVNFWKGSLQKISSTTARLFKYQKSCQQKGKQQQIVFLN